MQIEINQLRQQVRALKKMIGAIFGLMIAGWLVVFIGVRGTTEIVGQAGEFDTITTRKLVIESHAGDPWLVAEESLVEPDMPERGVTSFCGSVETHRISTAGSTLEEGCRCG